MTTKLLLGSILGIGLSICAQAQDIVIQDSDHFLVVYQKGNVSKNLAKKFLKTLEYGRSQILKWEFQEPSFMKKEKLSIYLIPQEKRKNKNSLGTFYGVQDPFIEITIAKKFSLQDYKSTLFHELFHAFQHGYVEWKHKWFAEATADAVMDELLISQKEIPHYISANDRYEFMFFWDLYSFDSLEGLHEYTSSIFFSYLIHEFKAGIDSIKKLWEEKPSSKDNTFTLLQKILGGEKQFQEILHQFSVALITGSSGKSPFGFSKPSLPILPLIDRIIVAPRIKDEKGYIKHFDSLTGSLSPKSLRLAPYSTKYVRLLSKNTEGIQDSLYLALPQNNTFSHAVLLPTENKTILYAFEKDRLEIPYFSNRGGPQEAILVVTNSTAQKIETPLTAAFSPPPHVARVKITDVQKKKVIYDTFWNSTSQNNRTFEEILNKADTDKRKKILLSFEVLFSRKVSQARLILPAISSSPLQELRNEGASGYTYRTKKSVWVEVLPATQEIPFYFDAKDEKDNSLDSNPKTIPLFSKTKWENYENEKSSFPSVGGLDFWHKLKTEKKEEEKQESNTTDQVQSGVVTSPQKEPEIKKAPPKKIDYCWELRKVFQEESKKLLAEQSEMTKEKDMKKYLAMQPQYLKKHRQDLCFRDLEITLGHIQYGQDKAECHRRVELSHRLAGTVGCPDLCNFTQEDCKATLDRLPKYINEVLKKFE